MQSEEKSMDSETIKLFSAFDPTIQNPKSEIQNRMGWSRREFIAKTTIAGAGTLLGLSSGAFAAQSRTETARIRLIQIPGICIAPMYVAETLLRNEGFTDVQFVKKPSTTFIYSTLASGETDIVVGFAPSFVIQLDGGDPVVVLSGVHAGCYELFVTDRVRAIRDLKGKRVAVPEIGSTHHVFLTSVVSYVGLNPREDIQWVTHTPVEAKQLLAKGEIDAYMGFPPDPQELRAKKIGRVLLNSAVDRPWSQYFCCMVAGNREYVRKNPAAAKRALRAILKADQMCSLEPQHVARLLVDKGYTPNYDYAFQAMKDVPYGKWREYDPEDTLRFYSLRLHEAGMIKSSPQKIIAQGTDWRFLRELKKELKT
jgi:NitT/TauT family transport system substrate-binding protein